MIFLGYGHPSHPNLGWGKHAQLSTLRRLGLLTQPLLGHCIASATELVLLVVWDCGGRIFCGAFFFRTVRVGLANSSLT